MVDLIIFPLCNDGDDVKSHFFIDASACEVKIGRADEVLLFLWRDEGFRFSEGCVTTCFYLTKYNVVLVENDKIHFQMVTFPVPVQDDIVVFPVIFRCQILAFLS